jgi:hypothetical protein
MPESLWFSWMCEAFGKLPSEIEREAGRHPPGWLEEIIEARQYAEAHYTVTHAKNRSDVPSSPTVDLVREIDMERAAEAYEAKKKAHPNG